MTPSLKGRTAFVTGAFGDLGRHFAVTLARAGAKVALAGRRLAEGEKLATAIRGEGGEAAVVALDGADPASVARSIAQARDALGPITILVNNAGVAVTKPALEWTDEDWRSVIEVNLTGCFLTCRAVVPHMIEHGYGRIVNISSVAGKEGNPNASHYSASKAGLIGLTKSLGKELAKTGVLVNAVTPAAAKTPIFDSMKPEHIEFMLSKIPMGRFLLVDEAASLIAWLATEDNAFSTAAVFDLSGGRATY